MADSRCRLVVPIGQSLDAMEWRPAPGFPDYEVSEYGHVRRATPGYRNRTWVGRLRKPSAISAGHLKYQLPTGNRERVVYAHQLVALAFIGPPPTPLHEVAHWDGVPANCHHTNLRWATPKENAADRYRHGTHARGEHNTAAILTEEDVREIRRLAGSAPYEEIGKRFGVGYWAVSNVIRRKTWKHVA